MMGWRNTSLELEPWSARAPWWVAIALGALVSADVVRWALVFSSRARAVPAQAGPAPELAARGMRRADGLQTILGAHLFGSFAATDPAAADSAADSARPLVLSGIMASNDPQAGRAIIAEQGRAAHVYRVGESLIGSNPGRVFEVLVDRVIIDFGGRFEALRLPRSRTGALGGADLKTAEAEMPSVDQPEIPGAPRPLQTMTQVAFAPFHERLGVSGHVELYPEMRIQRQFGLHDGDVLAAVNGIPVTGRDTLQAALRGSTDSLTLTVIRNGVSQTVSVPVDE
jgi:type II secretion system protein C